MAHIAHSDWMFEHSAVHHLDTPVDSHSEVAPDTGHLTHTDSVASVLKTLWHHTDLMNGTSSARVASGTSPTAAPTLTVDESALTVNAGGSVALPIGVTPSSGQATSVTISGLTSYESVTDNLDHTVFTGSSIALSAAEVNSGISLASHYTGMDHPVNTLTVTASETIGQHTLTSAAETIQVTDPPTTTSGTTMLTTATNGLTLQVSGDNLHGTDAQIQVFVDGQQAGGTYTVTADHASGQTQAIQVAGTFDPTVTHQVQIKFINDAWDGQTGDGNDINVYVESISLNGQTINGIQGTNTSSAGVVPAANATEAAMYVNGSLSFNVPVEPAGASASSSAGLMLQVSGDNLHGTDPQIQVFVDGQQVGATYTVTADHSSGQTQTIQVAGAFDPTVAHQVQIKFINDAWDGQTGDGNDINVYVESISLNGQTITGIQGTNTSSAGVVPATNATEAAMYVNGSLTFTVPVEPAVTGTSGGTSAGSSAGLTLQVAGDNLHGTDPQIQVFVDGQQAGGTYTVTADHSSGQTQTIQVAGTFDPTAAHQIVIKFINDAWDGQTGDGNDINVYVESISLNGQTITGIQGTNTASAGVVPAANATVAAMYVDGSLTFDVPADPPAGGSATASGTGASGSGTSTGATGSGTSEVGTGAGAVPSGPGFYVSPTGNDSNAGSLAAPFATLARAQQAMENSSIKTTYVEGGTYNITSTLNLTAADNGETWAYYPPNGVDSAVLDGGNTVDLFNISGAANITINGLKMQHVLDYAVWAGGAQSNNITVENCDIGFNQATSFVGGFNPILGLSNVTNAEILNNYVHDTASQGIALYAFSAGDTVDGSVISGNVVLRAAQTVNDGGAIYINMRYTDTSGGHVTISNNFVRDYGNSGVQAEGIYLDDDSSNVSVTGNIIAPPNSALASGVINTIVINGGNSNTISGNIIDAGASDVGIAYEGPGGTGGTIDYGNPAAPNKITGNIVLGNFAGADTTTNFDSSGHAYDQNPSSSSAWLAISNNLYYNYGGGAADSQGNVVSDSSPVHENPMLSGWTYTLAANSPVFGGSFNFQPIVGGWGPAGFVIPQDGAAPSSPH